MFSVLLHPHRTRKDWTIDDLVHVAAEVIPLVAGPQDRHKVTELPDPRTVRYYIQEEIVDRPHATAGVSALYGYRHLLQLVAIKVLQSHYLPIRRIRDEIKGLTNEQLEQRLDAWIGAPIDETAPPSARRSAGSIDLDSRLRQEVRSTHPPDDDPREGRRDAARKFLMSLRPGRGRGAATRRGEKERILGVPPRWGEAPPPAAGWRRFELSPGIELHVREELEVPESPSFLSVLASRLRVILEGLRRAKS